MCGAGWVDIARLPEEEATTDPLPVLRVGVADPSLCSGCHGRIQGTPEPRSAVLGDQSGHEVLGNRFHGARNLPAWRVEEWSGAARSRWRTRRASTPAGCGLGWLAGTDV